MLYHLFNSFPYSCPETVKIQIRWLLLKPADQDPHYLHAPYRNPNRPYRNPNRNWSENRHAWVILISTAVLGLYFTDN